MHRTTFGLLGVDDSSSVSRKPEDESGLSVVDKMSVRPRRPEQPEGSVEALRIALIEGEASGDFRDFDIVDFLSTLRKHRE